MDRPAAPAAEEQAAGGGGGAEAASSSLCIRLRRGFDLRRGRTPLPLESASAESLLAYLLLHREVPQPRMPPGLDQLLREVVPIIRALRSSTSPPPSAVRLSSPHMREFLGKQSHWLQVKRLPAYAPELNPRGVVGQPEGPGTGQPLRDHPRELLD